MTRLITTPNIAHPDAFYDRLIALHDGLDDAASIDLNARLILILMNHIGDDNVLREAMERAKKDHRSNGEH